MENVDENEILKINEDEIQNSKYSVAITNFEGPLDLLCFLISKNKMDIFEVSLSELTDEYIKYLEEMQELNMDIATEFLVMASSLLYLKSKKLLPIADKVDEEDDDLTEEDLINRIAMYKLYKEKQIELRNMYNANFGAFEKIPEKIKVKREINLSKYVGLDDILSSYKEILNRNENKVNVKAKEIEELAVHEKVTIKSKVKQIIEIFKNTKSFVFNNIFSIKKVKKIDVVTAFLSILELTRLRQVKVEQKESFKDITVTKIPKANFDISVIKE